MSSMPLRCDDFEQHLAKKLSPEFWPKHRFPELLSLGPQESSAWDYGSQGYIYFFFNKHIRIYSYNWMSRGENDSIIAEHNTEESQMNIWVKVTEEYVQYYYIYVNEKVWGYKDKL